MRQHKLKYFLTLSLSILNLFLFNNSIFAQGNFTIEWESPDGWHYSGFLKLDNNSNTYDLAFFDVNNPNSVRIYGGSTQIIKYSYNLPVPLAIKGIQALSYNEDDIYCNEFDVTGDGVNEVFLFHSGSQPYYTIINPVTGISIYSTPIYGFEVIDIDGDNFVEIIMKFDPTNNKIRIISTPAQCVSVQNQTSTVKNYYLKQNYPNPFNPETTIEYMLEKSSDVKVIIYDLTGKEISTLINEKQTAGTHKINFSANGLASGTYFYQLITNGIAESKKMILIK